MTRQITAWSTNTCGCTILYEWDSDVPDTERVHTGIEEHINDRGEHHKTKRCELHKHHNHPHKLFEELVKHNRANNNKNN